MSYVSSYNPNAPLPKVGSRWVWEIEKDYALELIEVVDVTWNGEEWWVRTQSLLPNIPEGLGGVHLNDVSRFWESCTPVGTTAGRLTERRPEDAQALR